MTAGICPSRRRRRTAREPVGRPTSAASTTSAIADLLRWREWWSRTARGLRRTAHQRSRAAAGRTTGPTGPARRCLVARRGFDLGKGGPSAAHLGDDLFGRLVPDKGLRIVVPVLGPDLDGFDQLGHRSERAAAQPPFGEFVEPALDEIEPRRGRWREVQVPAVSLGVRQPIGNRWRLVSREVVEDNVDVELGGDVEVDPFEEGQYIGG